MNAQRAAGFGRRPFRHALPALRLVEHAVRIVHRIRELAGAQRTSADLFHEGRFPQQNATRVLVRIENAYLPAEPLRDLHGFEQVGIVGNEHGDVEQAAVRVMHQVRRQVDVRALLFCFAERRIS